MNKIVEQRNLNAEVKSSQRRIRIYRFLSTHPTVVLSTVTPGNKPHGVVIYFDINEQFEIFFLTKSGTKKHANLVHNDRVMLTVYETNSQTSVQIEGYAIEIIEPRIVNKIAGGVLAVSLKISRKGLMPIIKLEAGGYVAYKIVPTEIRMAVFSDADSGDYEKLFISVESFDMYP